MAKKTKKQIAQERQDRLKIGGANITRTANQALSRQADKLGIGNSSRTTRTDPIASRVSSELNSQAQRLAEKRRREQQIKREKQAALFDSLQKERVSNKTNINRNITIGLRTDRPKLNMKYIGGGGAERSFDNVGGGAERSLDPDKGYEDKKLAGKQKVTIDDLLGNIKKQQTDPRLATVRRAGTLQGADNVKPAAGQNAKGTDGGRTFLQRSAEAQITNPNSRLNQVYRWRANAPSKTGNTEQDIRNYAAWQQEGQKLRMYDMGSDVGMWSDEKLAREIANEQKEAAEAAGARPETEEDRQALRVRGKEIREEKGAYTSLGVNGLEDWRHNRHIFEKPEDYEDDETYYDGLLWDAAHNVYDERGNVREGKTRYVDILQNGTDEEADAVVDEVENLWTRLQDGSIIRMAEENEELLAEERSIDAAFGSYDDSYLNSLLQEQGNRQQQNALIAGATGSGAYEAGNLPGAPQLRMGSAGETHYYVPGDKTDEAYFQINNSWRSQQESAYAGGVTENVSKALDQGYHWSQARNEWFLTDEEKQVFNKYYNNGDKANAQAFLDGLQSSLNARRTTYEQTDMRQRAAGPLGFLEGAATVPVNIAAGFAGIYNTIAAAVGDEDARDPNSKNWTLQRYIGTTRDERGNQWAQGFEDAFGDGAGDVGKFVYGVTMSMADNIAAMATAGGVTATVGLGGLSTRAAQAIVQLIMSGEATSATMLEQLENGKDPLEAALMAAGSGLIEAITEKYSLDALLDANPADLLGDARMIGRYLRRNAITEGSEEIVSDLLNTTLDEIMSMIRGHKSEIRIKIDQLVDEGMTEEDATRQVSLEYWGQVGLSGAAGALSGLLLSGGNVASNMFTQNAIGSRVRETEKKTGKTASFVETILGMDKETRSYKLANKIREAEQSGKTPSNRQIGQLVQNAVMESSQKDTEANRNVQESVAEAVGIKTRKPAFVADYASVGEQMAKEDDIREAEDNRKENGLPEITGSRKVIVLGEYGKVKGLVQTKAGLKYAVDVNGTENLVEASDIRATDFVTAAVIRNQATNPGLYSQGYTNQLLQEIESGSIQDAGRFLAEATSIRLAAHTGAELPKTSMPAEMAQRLYNLTKTEYAQTRKRETAADQRNAKGRGQGGATFKGAQYGTKAFDEKIAGLTKTQQDRINAYAELAKQAGIELTFLDNADIEAQGESFADRAAELYGTESKAGIELNIEGENIGLVDGKRAVTGRHHIGVAFGHEMTHWIQRNSLDGYNNLEKFVFDTLRQKNGNSYVNQRVLEVMQNQGLDIAGAMSEIVADSCDQILGSESLMKHIQETDQTLFGKIRDFVRSLVDRLRTAAQNMSESASWDARQMMGHVNELARIWLGAYDEVLSGKTEIAEDNGTNKTRNSQAGIIDYEKPLRQQLTEYLRLTDKEKKATNKALIIGTTPEVLTKIGLAKLPMTINYKHVGNMLEGNYNDAKYRDDHIFDIEVLSHLPELIADPVAIIKDSNPGTVRILVNMKSVSGKETVVPLTVNAQKTIDRKRLDVNSIKSVYGKTDIAKELIAFIQKDSESDPRLYYVNKEKTQRIISASQTKLSESLMIPDGHIRNIPESELAVNDNKYNRAKPLKNQTNTVQFGEWFGDSKVVDENKNPLIVYHGTGVDFNAFDKNRQGQNFSQSRGGFFFTNRKRTAEHYAKRYAEITAGSKDQENVLGVYLSIQNPYIRTAPSEVNPIDFFDWHSVDIMREADINGNDGIIVYGKRENLYIAFEPEQIKSATDNIGTFDKNKQNFRYSSAQINNRYMQAVNSGDMDTAQQMVDEAAEAAGYTKAAYHGTLSGGFTVFDKRKAHVGGNSGAGFYFSSNSEDSGANYSDVEGADNYFKAEHLAEKIENYIEETGESEYNGVEIPEDADHDELLEIAKQMLAKNPQVYNVYLDQGKAYVRDFNKSTNLIEDVLEDFDESDYNRDDFDDDDEYEDAIYEGRTEAIAQAISDAVYNGIADVDNYFEIVSNVDYESIIGDLTTRALDYEALTWDDVHKVIADQYIDAIIDEEGETADASSEITRAIVEAFGYDSIEDREVSKKFNQLKNMGEAGDTVHYIMFRSNQIKFADPVTYNDQGEVIPPDERFKRDNNDIRYSLADPDVRRYLTNWARDHIEELQDMREQLLGGNSGKMAEDVASAADRERLRQIDREIEKWEQRRVEAMGLDEDDLGAQYVTAWKHNDTARMEEILMEKLSGTDGVIPYKAPVWYDSERHRQIANLLKEKNPEAVMIASVEMAALVPKNAVLIPMPPHTGSVTENTDTMVLARAISDLTHRPVLNALEGAERERRQDTKQKKTGSQVKAEQLGFRQIAEIPEGMIPYFIDNVVGSGVTAQAAHDAIGSGITLAYAKSTRAAISGLKNAAATYTDRLQTRLIPLDDRFDMEMTGVKGTRYSQADTSGADVNMWMSGLTAGSLQTEDERQLLQSWKDLRMQIQLSLKRQLDYKEKLKRLQNAETLTPAERDDMIALQNRIEIQRNKQEQLENELAKVTSSEGYAGMMYRQNAILQDFIYGRTQEQVRDAVDAMVAEVDQLRQEINAQAKELDKLRNAESVKKLRKLLNEPEIKQMSDMLKAEYKSGMSTNEIGSRLAEMALRQMQGQDTAEDVRQLAEDLINKMRGISNDALESLRGRTLVIGEEQLNRLKAENTNLREIRSRLKGSGVRIAVQEKSRLQEQWAELRETNQALPDIDALEDADAVHAVVDYISQAVKNNGAVELFGIDMQEVEGMVQAAQGVVMTYLTDNAEARTQIRAAMDSQDNGSLTGIRERMNSIVQAGQKAKSWTTVLEKDVDQALEYYNKTARLAAREEKRKVREGLIAQLKSEHTGELIRQRMTFERQMKEDRKARHLAEDNKALRSKINTVTKRLAKLITAETDQKNIPEEAKPLARILLRMITRNDLNGHRKITGMDHDQLANISRVLDVLDNRNGEFKPEDLDWLITGEGENADYEIRDKIAMDLQNIESGILEYITAEGKRNITLQDRKNALTRIQTAASEIMDVIAAKQRVEINGRKMWAEDLAFRAEDDMQKSRFKGEWTGGIGKIIGKLRAGVMLGNMTPEYFFRFLHNDTLSLLFDEYHNAENRAGLEYGKAKDRIAQIAEEAGYSTWDLEKKYTVHLASGGSVQLNIEQMLQLYATWKREEALQAGINDTEKTYHLSKGGFYVENDAAHKIAGREIFRQRAYRMKAEDITTLESLLTPQQIKYAEDIVSYLSNEMSQLGNEASMRMYGIKKYNEKYYFPFEIWSGVKAVKSDTGAGGNQESHRAARPGFSNRLRNNANNALMIRGFTQTATRHIVGMINYNTFAPAIENTQRVMNAQTLTGEGDNQTRRNLWAVFGEAYGKDALDYFQNFQKELNGGATRVDKTFYDKLMSTFRKSAVAGSLSVSLQQPLSYIRASIMINPKYLAEAINPVYWKGSLKEMQEYSGVAVLKDMGKFDMGIGQSAQQFLTPDAKQGRIRTGYDWMSEKTTILPTLMDNMTWTRMWTACKLEQHALHPEMDMSSKEFLETVAKRFNDVLRKTQVYDSTLVRSRNMRSNNPIMKGLTSFMAEPTLTLNVLADAVMNAKEKGGKAKLAAAGAAFMLSAVAQALVKGLMGAGRTPDDKKTFEENVAYRFWYNFLNEANPLSLIPGYSDMITLLKKSELSDDAMSVFGKIFAAGKKLWNIGDSKNVYRDLEDSAGVLAQMFTNIPVKNLSRDARAMYNFFEQPYADRQTSAAVLKYQAIDQTMTADNLLGAINAMTGSGIYNTSNTAYYQRILDARRDKRTQDEKDVMDYLTLAKGVEEKSIQSGVNGLIRKDESMSVEDRLKELKEAGYSQTADFVKDQYKEGKITKQEATKLLKVANPKAKDANIYFDLEQLDVEMKTGEKQENSNYFKLYAAIEENKSDNIKSAVKEMLDHGYDKTLIKKQIGNKYKSIYLEATGAEKTKLFDALTKAYKAVGLTAEEARKTINSWKQTKK